jgi:coenzyme F420-reducing hydrogenase delta subunit
MNTFKHVLFLKKLFNHLGVSEDRIQQYFCSAADVEKFVAAVEDITKKVALLPPLPRKVKSELG